MKKLLLSFILIIFAIHNLFAQKDIEHWIAPFFDSSKNNYTYKLYFSTDSIQPFEVNIYNDNTLIGTVTISKGNPQTFTLLPQYICAISDLEAAIPINKGIFTKGSKPYFLSLRMDGFVDAEIITSKGELGLGTIFYTAPTPIANAFINFHMRNFTTGILATEDNTEVTVTGYDPGVQFINNNPPPPVITFTLNKGQSYIISGTENIPANKTGFIGAKIVSTKPIAVTNGNSLGGYGPLLLSGSDPVLDQSVPINNLGKEFAMVRGISPITNHNEMEGGLIVATENNTEVYINNNTTPVAILNEGEFYRLLNDIFIDQGYDHYNAYIKASKNIYLYQLTGGTPSGDKGAYSYMYPLNSQLSGTIDEIGMINEMPSHMTEQLKLTILTGKNATITVNGTTPTLLEGPYPLTGNSQWETYSITGLTGNLTINSDKAVIAGFMGQYTAAGYSSIFIGESIPFITKKTGDCIPGIVLEIANAIYDTYQWYLNGVAIPGATGSTYTPTQAGNYTVKLTKGTSFTITTPEYKVFTCLKETTQNIETTCSQIIQPTFTSSAQQPVPSTVSIVTPPIHGTATVNPNGTITYTPQNGYLGNDIIVYKFCGNAPEFIDCEQVTLTITVVPLLIKEATLGSCQYNEDNYAIFNLTNAEFPGYDSDIKTYYSTLADLNAGINPIPNPTTYLSLGETLYVKITTKEGCTGRAKLILTPEPIQKSPFLTDQYICMDATTTLDAGPDYDFYQWSTGETTSTIHGVGIGVYTVILGKDRCFFTQSVKVLKAVDPVIKEIEITNNTATIIVNGGTPPYQYSVDGSSNWQTSNVFTGLSRGKHTFYVKDFYNCSPISVELTILNLVNAITPNGDNKNDYIDYSELAYKDNLTFVIYDRYGNKIFTGDKNNNYTWDGRHFGKKVPTATYWYHITWNEPNKEKTFIKYSSWILLKNL